MKANQISTLTFCAALASGCSERILPEGHESGAMQEILCSEEISGPDYERISQEANQPMQGEKLCESVVDSIRSIVCHLNDQEWRRVPGSDGPEHEGENEEGVDYSANFSSPQINGVFSCLYSKEGYHPGLRIEATCTVEGEPNLQIRATNNLPGFSPSILDAIIQKNSEQAWVQIRRVGIEDLRPSTGVPEAMHKGEFEYSTAVCPEQESQIEAIRAAMLTLAYEITYQ